MAPDPVPPPQLGTPEFLRAILESTADGLLAVDEDGRTVYANRQFSEMWRIPPELLATRSDDRLLAFVLDQLEDPEAFMGKVRELYGTTRESMDSLFFKDGRVFDRYSRPLMHEARLSGRVWSFRDVTARKRTEEALRAREEQFAQAQRVAKLGSWEVDARTRLVTWSDEMFRLCGYEPGAIEASFEAYLDRVHPDDRAAVSEVHERAWVDLAPYEIEHRMAWAGGKDCVIQRRCLFAFDEHDQVVRMVGTAQDVTEQYRAEETSRETEAKYRTLIEQIPAITYIDAAGGANTTLYISPQTESLLGYTQQDWFDDPGLLSKHIHPEDRDRWKAELARIDATGEPFALEYRIFTPDGRVVWVHDRAVLVRDEAGVPRFWQGVMFDITERKEAETRMEKLWQQELEAGRRLRALDEMKNTFLQAVSHELRTPLTTILGGALTLERLRDELSSDETGDLLRRLSANARKLNRLLSDLLDLDRLARGILEPKLQQADVGELVKGILEESKDILGDRPVQTEIDSMVLGVEPAKVERIVENLLANTARHTPPGTPVWVKVTAQEEGALIVIEDAGPGIPERVRESIFEPFQQIAGRQNHAPGVGIGLSLVAKFAELHGGRAWVAERAGGGASFHVFLPRTVQATPAHQHLQQASGQ